MPRLDRRLNLLLCHLLCNFAEAAPGFGSVLGSEEDLHTGGGDQFHKKLYVRGT